MWHPKPELPFRWEKLRLSNDRSLSTYFIEWGDGGREYIYLRGGLSWKIPKRRGDVAIAKGIRVDAIGHVRYPVTSRNANWLEREYRYCGEGKERLFRCTAMDYLTKTSKGQETIKKANRYLNLLMEEFSNRIEKATRRSVIRSKLTVSGEFAYPLARDERS